MNIQKTAAEEKTAIQAVETKQIDRPQEENPLQLDLSSQGVSGFSLSSLRLQKSHQNKTNNKEEGILVREQEVAQESIQASWDDYTKQMTESGERNMVALLQLDQPRLKNKIEIHLSVPNNTNRVELEKHSGSLLHYLRNTLKNDHLTLCVHVDAKEDKKFIYTNDDKYNELVEKNPILASFKKQFKLEY